VRYLVTGAAGFIGARFVEAARRGGAELISVDAKVAGVFENRLEHRGLDFGETLDIDELEPFLEAGRAGDLTAVVHLGACTDTMELDERVHERLNFSYSKALWRWCARHGVPLVYASSAATYGDGRAGYEDDDTAIAHLAPLNPYGWSKQHFDRWALEREREREVPPSWVGLKFFNVYGFGERHKGRMASTILQATDQIARTGRMTLFKSHRDGVADGHQRRDFVYVDDVVEVLAFAASGGIRRGLLNLGTGVARTFADLARATFLALGRDPHVVFIDMPVELRERYQYFTEAKVARLRAAGYTKPFTSLEVGVRRYVDRLRSDQSLAPRRAHQADDDTLAPSGSRK